MFVANYMAQLGEPRLSGFGLPFLLAYGQMSQRPWRPGLPVLLGRARNLVYGGQDVGGSESGTAE